MFFLYKKNQKLPDVIHSWATVVDTDNGFDNSSLCSSDKSHRFCCPITTLAPGLASMSGTNRSDIFYNETMTETKAELRSRLKQARLGLSGEERQAASAIICERLMELTEWAAVRALHYFEPMISLGEVDISNFITARGKAHPSIEMFTSRWIDGKWQIVPIDSEEPVKPRGFDVIIVPMLGFDPRSLHRLGYGGGYYDRLLAEQPQAQKIGVCFEQGKLNHLPVDPHDIALDIVISEQEVY